LEDTDAKPGIPVTIFRFFWLPGNDVILNESRFLSWVGDVQTTRPSRLGRPPLAEGLGDGVGAARLEEERVVM
jgi:hypothetical protein